MMSSLNSALNGTSVVIALPGALEPGADRRADRRGSGRSATGGRCRALTNMMSSSGCVTERKRVSSTTPTIGRPAPGHIRSRPEPALNACRPRPRDWRSRAAWPPDSLTTTLPPRARQRLLRLGRGREGKGHVVQRPVLVEPAAGDELDAPSPPGSRGRPRRGRSAPAWDCPGTRTLVLFWPSVATADAWSGRPRRRPAPASSARRSASPLLISW